LRRTGNASVRRRWSSLAAVRICAEHIRSLAPLTAFLAREDTS
jgi:hypothetical protein